MQLCYLLFEDFEIFPTPPGIFFFRPAPDTNIQFQLLVFDQETCFFGRFTADCLVESPEWPLKAKVMLKLKGFQSFQRPLAREPYSGASERKIIQPHHEFTNYIFRFFFNSSLMWHLIFSTFFVDAFFMMSPRWLSPRVDTNIVFFLRGGTTQSICWFFSFPIFLENMRTWRLWYFYVLCVFFAC